MLRSSTGCDFVTSHCELDHLCQNEIRKWYVGGGWPFRTLHKNTPVLRPSTQYPMGLNTAERERKGVRYWELVSKLWLDLDIRVTGIDKRVRKERRFYEHSRWAQGNKW